jgi:hypothetical protein
MRTWILFDWGDTLMRTLPYSGPMCSWPRVETLPGALAMLQALQGRAGIALAIRVCFQSPARRDKPRRDASTRKRPQGDVGPSFKVADTVERPPGLVPEGWGGGMLCQAPRC